MTLQDISPVEEPQIQIQHCATRILELQQDDGRILWIDGGIFDPWNHTLSAMALNVAGHKAQARAAFGALHDLQEPDGSIVGQCGASVPLDKTNRHLVPEKATSLVDTNFAAFAATGIWHDYVLHQDRQWLARQFPLIEASMGFILAHQSSHGEIAWRRRELGEKLEEVDALRTGNCSIYKSLNAAIQIGEVLGEPTARWTSAAHKVKKALVELPFRFDRTWPSKFRFAMDWYYPILTGVYEGTIAHAMIASRMETFVARGLGCRCVSDEPWFTTAETCELVLALLAIGEKQKAKKMLAYLAPLRADEGGYWMGWQSVQNIYWPQERPSWTAAAFVLALDGVHQITPAANVLVGPLQSLKHNERVDFIHSRKQA